MAPSKESLDRLKIDRTAEPAAKPLGPRVAGIVAAVVVLGGVIWWFQRPKPAAVRTAVAREISSTGGSRTLLNASGYVTARRLATVSSKVTGRVLDVLIEEGMKVEEGQILAHLDVTNTEASLRLAEAQLGSARSGLAETQAQLDFSSRNLARTRSLAATKNVSEADLDQAKTDTDSLAARLARQQADVTVAERQVAIWKQQVDDAIIRAPFSGVVVAKSAQPGEMISPVSAGGGFTRTGICTIVDMKSLEVEVDVSESYINRVAAGQPVSVTLDSYPDSKIGAKVIAIVPTADRQKAPCASASASTNSTPAFYPTWDSRSLSRATRPPRPPAMPSSSPSPLSAARTTAISSGSCATAASSAARSPCNPHRARKPLWLPA